MCPSCQLSDITDRPPLNPDLPYEHCAHLNQGGKHTHSTRRPCRDLAHMKAASRASALVPTFVFVAAVATIGPRIRSVSTGAARKILKCLAAMEVRHRHQCAYHEIVLGSHAHMGLVFVVILVILLRPARTMVPRPPLCGILLPPGGCRSLLERLVHFACTALPRCLHRARIHDLPAVELGLTAASA